MSIDGALAIAASSLSLQQLQADTIANNIANANTPGYVQRELPQNELVSGSTGAGVVQGVLQRLGDATAAAAANQANSSQTYSQRMVDVLGGYTQTVGQPADSTSLPSVLSAFSQALTTLSASPNDATAQSQAVAAAQTLSGTFNSLNTAVGAAREQADQGIAAGVAEVNNTLDQLAQNEASLKQAAARGDSTAAFEDTRGQLLATLSNDLPIQVSPDGSNGIVVTTAGGTTLWDGQEHKLAFTATPMITSTMSVTADPAAGLSGGLSQVTVNGKPLPPSQGGSIAADLQLRDVTLPGFSAQLDQMASNLITTFQGADPSVSAGQTGLFTDAGAAIDPASPTPTAGLAGRIAINASVDPTQGGQVWRIRDGAQAGTPGAAGNNSTVLAFVSALQQQGSYDTTTGLPATLSLADAGAEIAGAQQSVLSTWTSTNTSRTQQAQDAQTALNNQTGVNVDEQLQRLLVVQQTFAATAQVVQAASNMLNDLNQLH